MFCVAAITSLYFYGARLAIAVHFFVCAEYMCPWKGMNEMKKLRKMLSLLLVGVIAVTSLFCGAVTAGAEGEYYHTSMIFNSGNNTHTIIFSSIDMNSAARLISAGFTLYVSSFYKNDTSSDYYEILYTLGIKDGKDDVRAWYFENAEMDDVFWDYVTSLTYPIDKGSDGNSYLSLQIVVNDDSPYLKKLLKCTRMGWNIRAYDPNTKIESAIDIGNFKNEIQDGTLYIEGVVQSGIETVAKSIAYTSTSSVSSKAYTGKAIKPSVTVKDGTKTLVKGTDYTLSYKNNTNIGTATVTITGKGSYTGSKDVTFKIVPPKTTLTAKKSNGKYALSWKAVDGITKYQIQYSTDGGKTYKTAGTVAASKTSTSLKLDTSKSYTFRIRSYKSVDGKKYYSSWSKAVTVK